MFKETQGVLVKLAPGSLFFLFAALVGYPVVLAELACLQRLGLLM